MSQDDIHAECSNLFNIWCERRAARPLRHLLHAWPLTSGLTDDWGELHEALRALRANCRAEISDAELARVEELIRTVAIVVYQR
jgi:hypothetical protein